MRDIASVSFTVSLLKLAASCDREVHGSRGHGISGEGVTKYCRSLCADSADNKRNTRMSNVLVLIVPERIALALLAEYVALNCCEWETGKSVVIDQYI